MQAVLYVGHGSRIQEGNKQFISFVKNAMPSIEAEIQEICFIELAEPSISEGIESCVKKGATNIAVVPVLLLSAGHVKIDIPAEITQAKQRFPHITFSYGRPFGVHDLIIDILGERLMERGFNLNSDHNVTVLLVGRGSSDPAPKRDLLTIASLLCERLSVKRVEVCYLAATTPNLEQGLEKVCQHTNSKIFVLPYLLFTGILINKMKRIIKHFQEVDETRELLLCDYLGYHPKLVDVLEERVNELL